MQKNFAGVFFHDPVYNIFAGRRPTPGISLGSKFFPFTATLLKQAAKIFFRFHDTSSRDS